MRQGQGGEVVMTTSGKEVRRWMKTTRQVARWEGGWIDGHTDRWRQIDGWTDGQAYRHPK